MQNNMLKKISLFLACYTAALSNSMANDPITLPPKTIHYFCTCKTPNAQGICHAYKKDGVTRSTQSSPSASTLPSGWIIQPTNCVNKQKYILTAGSVLFSGKKIAALYDKFKSPLSSVGYAYHVTPNLPFTQKNYSMIVIKNPAIQGIDLKNSQWECGAGNRSASCQAKWNSARCFVGNHCDFIYSAQ